MKNEYEVLVACAKSKKKGFEKLREVLGTQGGFFDSKSGNLVIKQYILLNNLVYEFVDINVFFY